MIEALLSSSAQLCRIRDILCGYHRLPFSGKTIPGTIMEGALAQVRAARTLGKYDFVDVVKDEERIGWQVKSTAEATPVTWKRAKIAGQNDLITASERGADGLQALGNAIIAFCNRAVLKSIENYNLCSIGYSRLIVHRDGSATYFERLLVTRESPVLFKQEDFKWRWSEQRTGGVKEQLSALHGVHLPTGQRWWAWHGRGENQLHFTGEKAWWPLEDDNHSIRFELPTHRFTLDELLQLLDPAHMNRPEN